MNKIARLPTLAVILAASVGTTVFTATSTVTGDHARSDMQSKANKVGGFNLKYRYEQDNNPLDIIGSFTCTEKDSTNNGTYNKSQHHGITAGPAHRLNDWINIYGVVGIGHGKFQNNNFPGQKSDMSDHGLSCGADLQFSPIGDVALNFSYGQSRIRNIDASAWIAGVGYRF